MTIEGTNIKMIRGDTESITVLYANEDGTKIPLVTGDIVYFTVKKKLKDTVKVFQKVVTSFTDGNAIIVLEHLDTNSIEPGIYTYDIQLNRANGSVTTIIQPSEFELKGGVTDE